MEVYDVGYHPIESLMRTTMDSLKDMVDVNTVVGEPVETKEGTVIIPVSRVSFGFVTGGGDESVGFEGGSSGSQREEQSRDSEDEEGETPIVSYEPMPFTGGTGAGVSVRPVGFLVVGERKVRFLPVDSRAMFDRLLEEAPEMLDRVAGAFGRRRDDRDEHEEGERDEHRRGDRSRDRRADIEE